MQHPDWNSTNQKRVHMGEVIGARADVARIEDHVRSALRNALARGAEIAEHAEKRLSPALASIDTASALKKSADETEATAWAAVLAEDAKSDIAIGAVRDAMWNAVGRTRQNPYLEQVFPGGASVYTSGAPSDQPVLMQVLRSRILSAAAPQWTEAQRNGWAAEIETRRATYDAAIQAYRPAEATALVATQAYRAAVHTGQARLRAFKRDLLSLGLTDAQIHEIIPDAASGSSAAKPAARDGSGIEPAP
jgi:hypothetical protein